MRQKWRSAMINKGWGYKSHKTKDHHTIVAKEDTKKKHLTNLSLHHILWPFILFLSFYSFSATTTTKLLQVPLITGTTHSYSVYIPLSVFHSFMGPSHFFGVFHLFFLFLVVVSFISLTDWWTMRSPLLPLSLAWDLCDDHFLPFCNNIYLYCLSWFFCHTYRYFLNC